MYNLTAAAAFASLSAPASFGESIAILNGNNDLYETQYESMFKYSFIAILIVSPKVGTTDEIIDDLILSLKLFDSNKDEIKIPYSSDVFILSEAIL